VLFTLRCPGRAWDQVLLEIAPAARTCDRDVARFQLLVQGRRLRQLVVRSRKFGFAIGIASKDVASSAWWEAIKRSVILQFAAMLAVDEAEVRHCSPQR
jgi:hypothetical protein